MYARELTLNGLPLAMPLRDHASSGIVRKRAMVATEPSADRPARPPARLAAKRVDGTVTFVNRAEAKVRMNDEESTRISITTWTFTVTGDELAGTIDRRIEGLEMAMAGPQSFKGTRAKS